MDNLKTLIALPCMDMIPTSFFKSMLSLKKVGYTTFAITCSSLIYDARNQLAKRAVDEGYDRILWLDSDMEFAPDLMERLVDDLTDGREFVSGLYFTRRNTPRPVVFKECAAYRDENGKIVPTAECYADYPKDSVFECQGVGFGGCIMTTDLVKRVIENYGLPFSPVLGFGEDLSFCCRVRELGGSIWVDSRIKLGHLGYRTITEDDYAREG